MRRTRIFLAVLLIMTVFAFSGCGRDNNPATIDPDTPNKTTDNMDRNVVDNNTTHNNTTDNVYNTTDGAMDNMK